MQPLARNGFSVEQITGLLQGDVEVSAGCELLRPDLTVVEDISDDLVGGQVQRNMNAAIHGTCTLQLTRRLRWGIDLVRPYMILTSLKGGVSARFNLGVFAITTPLSEFGEEPQTYEAQGYDRLHLLSREVGATYTAVASTTSGTVTTATTYRKALLDAFAAAGLSGVQIEGGAADSTLPKDRVWLLVGNDQADPDQTDTPVTWLRVVNDLLRAINFRAVWADENGTFRCQSYQDPGDRASEFTFDADDITSGIVGDKRILAEDVWGVPNRWVFRRTNRPDGAPAPTEGDGIYTVVNQSDGPTSIDGRGLTWTAVIDYEAASQAILVSLGKDRVAIDRRRAAKFELTTGPFPPAGHADVFTYRDMAAGGEFKVQAETWEMSLDGSDMSWTWKAVT